MRIALLGRDGCTRRPEVVRVREGTGMRAVSDSGNSRFSSNE